MQVATGEGLTEEVALTARASEITEDAFKEAPETEIGKSIKQQALEIIANHEKGIESPYFPKPKFNYTGLYIKTANASIPKVFEVLNKYFVAHPECFGRVEKSETDEEAKARESIEGEMAEEVFKILDENDVKVFYYSLMFEDIKNMVSTLEKKMTDRLAKLRGEILDISIGVKNPDPDNSDLESRFATHAELENMHKQIVGDKKKTSAKDVSIE